MNVMSKRSNTCVELCTWAYCMMHLLTWEDERREDERTDEFCLLLLGRYLIMKESPGERQSDEMCHVSRKLLI